jgi:lysophospholipase L1-like esterase
MEMIELSQQSGAKVVLINVELPFIAQLAGTQLEQVYGEVAKEAKVPVIDYPLGSLFNKQGMMLPDRLHPTEAAQEGLKEAMAPGLIKIVQE